MAEAPFSAPDGLALTTKQVLHEGWPILLVTHDADDGAWQFVNGRGDTDDIASAMLVHPSRIVALDPEIATLSDLPHRGASFGKGTRARLRRPYGRLTSR